MKKSIAEKLKRLRILNKISQAELARRTGLTSAAISMIEKGGRSPSLKTLQVICESLHMTLDEFLESNDVLSGYGVIAFYNKYHFIEKLSPNDQELILTIVKRLNK